MEDKIRWIKEEARTILKERILKQKIKIDTYLTRYQKEELSYYLERIIQRLLRSGGIVLSREEIERIKEEIILSFLGYGAIEVLIKDPEITDIIVNGPKQVYIEKKGQIQKVDLEFDSDEEIFSIIEKMMIESGRRLDRSSPFVEFRMKEGSRVTAVIPPVSSESPSFCIRKALQNILSFEDLLKMETLDRNVLKFLEYCVKARVNILISGATGVGKTTLLNLLIKEFVPEDERIVIVEDTKEIIIDNSRHFLRLLTRPPNVEGKGEITLQDLVKLALHLRPDRIIIGEVRGEEAFYFLQSINTGHDGSMCTIHANDTEDALMRLEILSLMDRPNLQQNAVRRFIKLGIDLLIHMIRLSSGERVISQVSEFELRDSEFVIKDIFSLKRGIEGTREIHKLEFSGHIPSFWNKLKVKTDIPDNFFERLKQTGV